MRTPKRKKLEVLSSRVAMAMGIFDQVFPAATTILIYIVAAHMLETGPGFSIGRFLAFNAAFGQFLGSALGFSTAVLSLIGIIPIYERAKPILEEEPEQRPDLLDPGVLTGSIDVSHVTFRYTPDGPVVLNDLSLSIKAGQYVAFVGESGCGKSTMMRLLLGFETPENGSIFYEGRDFAELDKQAVRKQIGVVLQAGKLMPADVYTNIVGAAALSIDMAWEAAKRAGLDDDIRAMPMGMHTVISAAGGGLSGGQKQRIMIARALVNRPRILFFDEATSALDNQTQAVVSESLRRDAGHAHRDRAPLQHHRACGPDLRVQGGLAARVRHVYRAARKRRLLRGACEEADCLGNNRSRNKENQVRKVLYLMGILSDTDVQWMATHGKKKVVPAGEALITPGQGNRCAVHPDRRQAAGWKSPAASRWRR